jgi:hypothetical protein
LEKGHGDDNTCAGRVWGTGDVPLSEEFDCNVYTLVRLYDLKLYLTRHDEVISLLELQDESVELGVLTTYIPKLKELLGIVFLNYSVDWEHWPFDPSLKAVESFCATYPELSNDYTKAKARMVDLFSRRAEAMIKDGWPMQITWYSHLLGLIPK